MAMGITTKYHPLSNSPLIDYSKVTSLLQKQSYQYYYFSVKSSANHSSSLGLSTYFYVCDSLKHRRHNRKLIVTVIAFMTWAMFFNSLNVVYCTTDRNKLAYKFNNLSDNSNYSANERSDSVKISSYGEINHSVGEMVSMLTPSELEQLQDTLKKGLELNSLPSRAKVSFLPPHIISLANNLTNLLLLFKRHLLFVFEFGK